VPAPAIGLDDSARARRLAWLSLLGAWALFFAPHLLSDGVPYFRDALVTILPIKAYLGERLRALSLPQWYPYEALGMPFIGQVATATFHPQSLLSLVLPPTAALKANTLLAYVFAAAGAYRLARAAGASRAGAVAGAFALAFGGYALGTSSNLGYLVGAVTLPWVAEAALRVARDRKPRDAALLALFWALLLLSGDAQSFLLAPLLLLAALFAVGPSRRGVALLAASGALAALLACCELLPALALSPRTVRIATEPLPTLPFSRALHPFRLLELLCAGFIPEAQGSRFVGELLTGTAALWSTTVFAGATALLLAGLGAFSRDRRAWAFAAVLALSLALALGGHTPALGALWRVAPPLGRFRFPEKYLALFWTALCPLVALGVDRAIAQPRRALRAALAGAALVGALSLAAWLDAGAGLWALKGRALAPADPLRDELRRAWSLGFGSSAGFLALCALLFALGRTRPRALALLPALLFAELWLGNGNQLPLVPRALLEAPAPFAELVRRSAAGAQPPHRVVPEAHPRVPSSVTLGDGQRWAFAMKALLRSDTAGLEGLTSFGMNLPATSVRADIVLGLRATDAAAVAPYFDGCFRVSDAAAPARPGDERLAELADPPVLLVRQPCAPRARLSGMRAATGPSDALSQLRAGLPRGHEVWERGTPLPPAQGTVRWLRNEPEWLELEVEAQAATALVIADEWAPGWSALVDGAPAPLRPVDVVARGVPVPAGRHRVELRYRTPRLPEGLALSACGLAAVLLLLRGRRP
jgi:hypothetical protein